MGLLSLGDCMVSVVADAPKLRGSAIWCSHIWFNGSERKRSQQVCPFLLLGDLNYDAHLLPAVTRRALIAHVLMIGYSMSSPACGRFCCDGRYLNGCCTDLCASELPAER